MHHNVVPQDVSQETASSSQDDDSVSQDNESSQIIQVGVAKRADNFVPKMYSEKKMNLAKDEDDESEEEGNVIVNNADWTASPYNTATSVPPPNYFHSNSNTTSSHSSVSNDKVAKQAKSDSSPVDEGEFDANFIELLQFGDTADLHMV